MIYTVTLNPAIDYVVRLGGSLQPGGINRSAQEDYEFGGKGVNVSRVLHALGVESALLGFVAGFTGEGLEQGLRGMGLDTRFIRLPGGMTRINVKLKAGEETEINGMGPGISPEDMDRLYAQLETIGEGDVLVLSGSIPAGLPEDTYARIMARVSGRGVRVVVDASGPLLESVLACRPFLIKPNHIELGGLFGRTLSSDEEIEACARSLQKMGARNVLVSMAARGALLLDEHGRTHRIACPAGQVVNSVGAGDSMVAGFVAGYLESGDYSHALRLGTAAGSATAFSVGLAQREQIERLLAESS
ncbi:MAG: 1-phosphofructokinase [Clostridia bacterium]|nr:1-phosphofructokinase [Clostridia bacterium]